MTGLIMAAQLILGLSILVTLHELGHFLAARAFGIRVEKFYLFFDAWNVKLFSFKYGDTEYGIGWLPLGGYVKIAGMVDESMDTEAMKLPAKPWEFRSKPAWQRLIVMIGGVTVNVIVGIIICWMLIFKYGESYTPNSQVKNGIVTYDVAQSIGLKTGDRITEINGQPFERFEDLYSPKVLFANTVFTVVRGNETLKITLPPDFLNRLSGHSKDEFIDKRITFYVAEVTPGSGAAKAGLMKNDLIIGANDSVICFFDQIQAFLSQHKRETIHLKVLRGKDTLKLDAGVDPYGKLGFAIMTNDFTAKTEMYGLGESFERGYHRAFAYITDNIKGLKKIFKGEVSARNSLQGPVGMAKIYGGTWDWIRFWSATGLISMILAFMNILPIPALDGGHVVFLLVEALTGRKFSDKFMEKTQLIGMALLLALMVFAIGNDFSKFFK